MLSSTTRLLLLRRSLAVTAATAQTRNHTAVSGYGDPEQTGFGVDLEGQSRATSEAEHPGREPVKEGRGTGTGGYDETGGKPDGETHAAASAGGDGKGDKHHHPQPKILDDSQTKAKESEGTKKHNREMDQRYDHEKDGKNDKVDKGFWKGTGGGRERGP
ncbi:hypothetical protein BZA05DRAFT_414362 [Tricharina praecox]|uniref:uncharacterized protein n=1 Tax=Tricharina praecox TaxID=43433 RepID=UPI00221E6F37|nr:uncharacterized protein BZA05DRAFT_414362 [Tricharina praecox]KAI5858581.1 hypothetical protein BZA05DRAFT_414362 [Tricharina praecox]